MRSAASPPAEHNLPCPTAVFNSSARTSTKPFCEQSSPAPVAKLFWNSELSHRSHMVEFRFNCLAPKASSVSREAHVGRSPKLTSDVDDRVSQPSLSVQIFHDGSVAISQRTDILMRLRMCVCFHRAGAGAWSYKRTPGLRAQQTESFHLWLTAT